MANKAAAESKALGETADIQQETIEALRRIQEHAEDTEEMGALTLEDLKHQKYAMNNIVNETDRIDRGLDETRRLQNKLGRWTLTFGKGRAGNSRKSGYLPKRETPPKREKKPPKHIKLTKKDAVPKHFKENKEPDVMFGATALKESHADECNIIEENDQEIDSMLDETADILGRLEFMSSNINNEVRTQKEALGEVERNVERANDKQDVANSRARNFLTGKWRKNGDE
eukprot:CAMPEP_0119022584 /NCGR_PEP_ID=MMETSP1176-20130426/28319_1 /TAXON_ID=265551 /ORGANISM="Synedropsis recta cf, Strain CCMP1620" /LENGTH=228 /DNA_ID=CAMNT_0006977479 /DNA_START=195 /DNA_END=881 /DNA_ORIENTATION=-